MEDVALPDPVETMERLGAAFRAMVSGIRHALIARSEVKREFRIETTMIRTRGNNLLKFSANDDDALAGLLGAGRHTDMGAEEAVTDALTDIRLHELASMTAMQTAVRALVVRLGPDQIRDGKDHGGNRALLGNRKARAWDAYEALHAEVCVACPMISTACSANASPSPTSRRWRNCRGERTPETTGDDRSVCRRGRFARAFDDNFGGLRQVGPTATTTAAGSGADCLRQRGSESKRRRNA